jgi:RNA polymerase sigma-70 factor (ECF subfamily)
MDAFTALYERHYRDVYRFALFLTGDPARAEDLASDTFVRALMARDRIREPTVRAYLLAITRNLHRDHLRRPRHVLLELDERAQDGQPRADRRTESRSELRRLHGQLRHVAAGDRRALLLYAVRHLSYAEIAARLGVSAGAVKSRIARARDALRASTDDTKKREPTS